MKMVALLEEYVNILKEVEIKPESAREKVAQSYHMPADIVSSDEWAEFDNVYQIHCPSISMDSAVRDVRIYNYSLNTVLSVLTDHDAILLLLSRSTRLRVSHGDEVNSSLAQRTKY